MKSFPTFEHANAAQGITDLFSKNDQVDAILLTNSCARGKATPDSCLDMVVLINETSLLAQRETLEAEWVRFQSTNPSIQALRQAGQYTEVHLDFINGIFTALDQEEGGTPDSFELEIGNYLVYGVPLWQSSNYLESLKHRWLPYYDDDLRQHRLTLIRHNCLHNLAHIPLYVKRGLYFQSLDRLYNAHRELLQAVFISRRVYPLAYNKWIHEQVVDILGLPQLYEALTHVFEIKSFESFELTEKAQVLENLLHEYAPER